MACILNAIKQGLSLVTMSAERTWNRLPERSQGRRSQQYTDEPTHVSGVLPLPAFYPSLQAAPCVRIARIVSNIQQRLFPFSSRLTSGSPSKRTAPAPSRRPGDGDTFCYSNRRRR